MATRSIDTFDEIAVATLDAIQDSGAVADNVYSGDPVWAALMASKRKRTQTGGDNIRVNLRRSIRPGGQSYRGADQMPYGKVETLGYALFPIANYAIDIFIPETDILANSGKEQVVNLVTDKVQEANDRLTNQMTADMYGDGTGNGGKNITGLGAAILATGTYGGIDRGVATGTFWQAKATAASPTTVDLAMLRTKINTVRGPGGDPRKQGKVDLIATTQTIYEAIEGLYDDKVRIPNSDLTLGKLGFQALQYAGTEIVWSDNVTSGEILFLSTSALGFTVDPRRDFQLSPFEKTLVNGVDGRLAWLFWRGNITCNECRRLGKLTGVTP